MVASMAAIAAPSAEPTGVEVENDGEEVPAGVLLERAFVYFHHDRPQAAANAFRAAIATGNLNDAGRTLAYWHIFLCESRLRNEDVGTEALASFVVVAEDVLDARDSTRYAVTTTGDFVDRFDLASRVARARGLLSATWARRVPAFGRTADNPVPVHNDAEGEFFLRYAPPCGEADERQVQRQILVAKDHIERATVACEAAPRGAEYFLQYGDAR